MPRRTNDFQTLMALIQRELAPDGARVTESKLVSEPLTEIEREIDIAIEVEVNDFPILLALECRDHARAATVEWIDGLVGKYRNLPVNKFIAVSRSGFTRAARDKAAANNIQVMTISQATTTDWPTLAKDTEPRLLTVVRRDLAGVRLDVAQESTLRNYLT